ncbi:MAG: arginine--tRNA ligase, partial [Candidatus Marsarchaeota archaeon]|nr:arginine--tRNA ligase [Candidatus Marsarchaeota archaeon]
FSYDLFSEQGKGKRPLYSTGPSGKSMDFGGADIAINTIDARQSYEQSIVRLAITLLGGPAYSDSIKHVAYGVVDLEGASLSGRKGTWVGYTCDDLLREAEEKASKLITDRFKLSEEEKSTVSLNVALSAIKYEFLKLSNEKNLVFSWERALNFEGNSGPYCEYMHARAQRILENASKEHINGPSPDYNISDVEFELVKRISYAQEVLEKSARECRPNSIVEYLTSLATDFGKFYENVSILKAKEGVERDSRLAITMAFAKLSAELLEALGIRPVSRM